MQNYMKKRYHLRINQAKEQLGGQCVKCGTKENLQFDHIDPTTKTGTIAEIWSYKKDFFDEEIKKCQLLCDKCHEEKTLTDLNRVSAKNTHGTLSSYKYCKCDICRKNKSAHQQAWRLKRKRKT